MNFDFSPEQEELRRAAQRVLADGLSRARKQLGAEAPFDAALWQSAVDGGWTAAAVPESLEGLGLGPLEWCVLAEEIGRSLAPIPFVSSALRAGELLRQAGAADEATCHWLPQLAAGKVIGTLALTEAGQRHWDERPTARVEGGRLSGVKTPVADVALAGLAIVSARAADDGDGFGLFAVDLKQDGIALQALTSIDRAQAQSTLHAEGVRVLRIGTPGQGQAIVRALQDAAAVYGAFEQLGAAEALLKLTIDYVKTRKAFGREVASYQAVKHKLADMYVRNQLARSHAYFGAWALTENAPELPRAAAGARLAAMDALSYAAEEAVELHGGIGFTWECDIQLYYRRARALAVGLGGRSYWARRLVDALAA